MDDDRDISEEEAALWDTVTQQDERWKTVQKSVSKKNTSDNDASPSPQPATELPNIATTTTKNAAEFLPLAAGEMVGVDRSTAEKLRRGKLSIDARLDLHGMTQVEAQQVLHQFIHQCTDTQKRCVLVVTGKGEKNKGVLRTNVPHWLNMPELRPNIIAFSYATPKDGGDGALYVLLRRQR